MTFSLDSKETLEKALKELDDEINNPKISI